MATLWLTRHGETTWNLAGRYQGRMESPLSERGALQAAALAEAFVAKAERGEAIPARIVASPLERCRATAAIVAERLRLPVEIDGRLIEIAHGTWDGRYRDDLAREDAERYRRWREDPAHASFENGESLIDVLARWQAFARDAARATQDALAVTHDAVVRCALVDVQGRPLADFWKMSVENASLATLVVEDGRLRLLDECDVRHLAGVRADARGQAL